MAYMRFELLHEMFFIVTNSSERWFLMCPLLSKSGQYLQILLLQKLNPLFLLRGRGLPTEVALKSKSELEGLAGGVLCNLEQKKSVIDFCFCTLEPDVDGSSATAMGGL